MSIQPSRRFPAGIRREDGQPRNSFLAPISRFIDIVSNICLDFSHYEGEAYEFAYSEDESE